MQAAVAGRKASPWNTCRETEKLLVTVDQGETALEGIIGLSHCFMIVCQNFISDTSNGDFSISLAYHLFSLNRHPCKINSFVGSLYRLPGWNHDKTFGIIV